MRLGGDLAYAEAEPGVFTIRDWTGAWSANVVLQTRQSLASSDFRLVFKTYSDANQGKHGISF